MKRVRFRDSAGNVRGGRWAIEDGEPVVTAAAGPYGRIAFGDESYDPDEVASALEAQVNKTSPGATFRCERPEDVSSVASVSTDVVRTIRVVAQAVDATVVFIGSENAGRVSTPVTSVGAPVSEDPRYDVHIVRHAREE